jgi:hypothetical protein
VRDSSELYSLHSADTHEIKCIEDSIEAFPDFIVSKEIFGDKSYAPLAMDLHLEKEYGIILSLPKKKNQSQILYDDNENPAEQRGRWKIEHLFAWLKSFRRVTMRWEYYSEKFLAMVYLAAATIVFSRF